MADLLPVADVCIKALKAQVWFLDACNKGPSNKKQQEDQEVNAADRGNQK
jgi:hypothetical protein